jgi:hypothetical protein
MLDDYLEGAASQLIERASALKGKLPRPSRREFDRLASECCSAIDAAIAELKDLRDGNPWKKPEHAAIRLLEFRRIASNIDRLENEAVAPIVRSTTDEGSMVALLYRMGEEVIYPIEMPTVSMLSQNYFYIRTDFRLMCIPLMEIHFLLHLPDVYHELAHPLFRTENDPRTKNWLESFSLAKAIMYEHFHKQITAAESSRTPEAIKYFLQISKDNWLCQWMEEIFCDLFALFSVGPAYAWAHLHLHAERGRNAFEIPQRRSSHPADGPRMTALLNALLLLGEKKTAGQIEARWSSLLTISAQTEPPDYHRYYPQAAIRRCVEAAFDGFLKMGCQPWPGGSNHTVRTMLNEAWQRFWHKPEDFVSWERGAARTLLR